MDEHTFKQHASQIVSQFYSSADFQECAAALLELRSPEHHALFVKKLISSALDGTQKRCELASQLLAVLSPEALSGEQAAAGFMKLAHSVDDLSLDVPRAPQLIASFIARCISDRVLPSDFASNLVLLDPKQLTAKAHQVGLLARAKLKLAPQRSEQPGPAGVQLVGRLKQSVSSILDEYLANPDIKEACHAVWALASPYFHHEVVKQTITLAYHSSSEARTSILELFHALISSGTIAKPQVSQGIERCLEGLHDALPEAPSVLALFVRSAARSDAVESTLSERVHSMILSATELSCSPPRSSFHPLSAPSNHTLPCPESSSGLHAALHALSQLLVANSSAQDCTQSLLAAPGAPHHFVSLCLRAAKGGESSSRGPEQCGAVVEVLRSLVQQRALGPADVESGFCHALLRELAPQDVQHAQWITMCLARLVAGRVLSPVCVSTITAACEASGAISSTARAALQEAGSGWRTLCAEGTGKRAPVRNGQGLRRAQHPATRGSGALQHEIDQIVRQLLGGRLEIQGAAQHLAAMNTPYMAPGVVAAVFRAAGGHAVSTGALFLASLCASGLLTQAQLRSGIQAAVHDQRTSPETASELITALLDEGSISKAQLPPLPETVQLELSSSCCSSQASSPKSPEAASDPVAIATAPASDY